MPKLICIIGPTATGKTDAGIALAKELNTVVISADSRQLYAGMNIGTAKPEATWSDNDHSFSTPDDIEGIPHYGLNVRLPNEPITLSVWQKEIQELLKNLFEKYQTILLVGGTMLYADSIRFGFTIPQTTPNPILRQALEQQPLEELYTQLQTKDPEALQFIEPHNKQRIIRALEVIQTTGQPFSAQRQRSALPYTVETIGIFPGWDVVKQRIASRIQDMISHGLLEETKKLQETYGIDLPLLNTINYAQVAKLLAGEYTPEEALEKMVQANVRYAHRQMSWWQRDTEIIWQEKNGG